LRCTFVAGRIGLWQSCSQFVALAAPVRSFQMTSTPLFQIELALAAVADLVLVTLQPLSFKKPKPRNQ
jgi:hypothetical protein